MGRRSIPAALLAGALLTAGAGSASAQIGTTGDPDPTTATTAPTTATTTTAPTTTAPPPPLTVPPAPTTTAAPPAPEPTPAPPRSPTTPPPASSSTTHAPLGSSPPVPATLPAPTAPAVGGDSAEPPPGTAPVIPPELQRLINSVRRSGGNSTSRLLEALAPLRAMGMTEQEAVQAGFGRFPVGGRATFADDWWYPRYGPGPGVIRLHEGTDIFAAYGTPARAPADGVLKQSFNPVGGLASYVFEPNGTYYYLAHLSRFEAGQVTGQAVKAGDVIGYVGDSGNARGTSPHVHFEVHPRGGGPVNPKPWLDARLREALAAVPAVVGAAAPRLAARPQVATEEQELGVVGHDDLGGGGGFGAVAVVGDTALVARDFVAPGSPPPSDDACAGTVAVVDLSDPTAPQRAATITLPRGQRAEDVEASPVRTPSFSGDLVAVVAGPCAPGEAATGLAYYDVTDRARPRLLSRVLHPRELAGGAPGADACALALRSTCPRGDRSVDLHQTAGGRVLSLSSSGGRDRASRSEAFAVDVTDPRKPSVVGWSPLPGRTRPPASSDGCSPVALDPPAATERGLPDMVDIAGFHWQPDGAGAGLQGPDAARAYPTVVEVGGRRLAVVTDDHWWSASWALRVDPPAAIAGDRPGCPGPLAGGDLPATSDAASAGPTAGPVVYVGRGCPERRDRDGTTIAADPYLADPAGRIAVADAALAPVQSGLPAQGCSPASRLARARATGALGVVVAGSFLASEPGGDAVLPAGSSPARPPVPGVQLRKPDGDAVRDVLCPPSPDAGCTTPEPLSASLVELPGRWGGVRILDVTNPEAPREVEVFATPNGASATPADAGRSFAVHSVVADGTRVYAAWGSDGLRVVDLASGAPVEVASFLPPAEDGALDEAARADAGGYVTGVDHTEDHIVVSDLATGLWVLDKRPPPGTRGYWLADDEGGVFAFGDAPFLGSAAGADLDSPVVGMASSSTGRGYWLVARDGGVFAFGDAHFAGSQAGAGPAAPVVGMASSSTGRGYWLVARDGGVFAFGDAHFAGSLAGSPLTAPVVALVATPSGRGYWLIGADGGVFSFGDAPFLGSIAGTAGAGAVVGAASTASGRGYWLVTADGGVFAFGDARFKGSMVGQPLAAPVVGVAAMTGVRGYWLAAADGGVDALGTPHLGARTGDAKDAPVVAMASVPRPPAVGRGSDGPLPARREEKRPGMLQPR